MTDILKKIRDNFFTYRTFFWLLLGGFVWLVVAAMQDQTAAEEEAYNFMETCYNDGLVPVDTEVGPRCVDPEILMVPGNES